MKKQQWSDSLCDMKWPWTEYPSSEEINVGMFGWVLRKARESTKFWCREIAVSLCGFRQTLLWTLKSLRTTIATEENSEISLLQRVIVRNDEQDQNWYWIQKCWCRSLDVGNPKIPLIRRYECKDMIIPESCFCNKEWSLKSKLRKKNKRGCFSSDRKSYIQAQKIYHGLLQFTHLPQAWLCDLTDVQIVNPR